MVASFLTKNLRILRQEGALVLGHARRCRPRLEQPRLAVDGRLRRRCRAVFSRVQPGAPGEQYDGDGVTCAAGCPSSIRCPTNTCTPRGAAGCRGPRVGYHPASTQLSGAARRFRWRSRALPSKATSAAGRPAAPAACRHERRQPAGVRLITYTGGIARHGAGHRRHVPALARSDGCAPRCRSLRCVRRAGLRAATPSTPSCSTAPT